MREALSRREMFLDSGSLARRSLGLALSAPITLNHLHISELLKYLSPKEYLTNLGIDGKAAFQTHNTPVDIAYLNNYREISITLDNLDVSMIDPQLKSAGFIVVRPNSEDPTRTTALVSVSENQQPVIYNRYPLSEKADWEVEGIPVKAQSVRAELPYVTGDYPRKFFANLGFVTENAAYLAVSMPRRAEQGVLAHYMMIDYNFYDNKVLNIASVAERLNRTMMRQSIPSGGVFSYLRAIQVDEFLRSSDMRIGYGLKIINNEVKRVPVIGGGICALSTLCDRVAVQAEAKGFADQIKETPHDKKYWYYKNSSDPYRGPRLGDATVYFSGDYNYGSVDFTFRNTTSKDMFMVADCQIIPDPPKWMPKSYNSLVHNTAFLVISLNYQDTPPTHEQTDRIKAAREIFRDLRKI